MHRPGHRPHLVMVAIVASLAAACTLTRAVHPAGLTGDSMDQSAPPAVAGDRPGPLHFTTPTGTEVLIAASRSAPVVSIYLSIRAGSALDPPGMEGLAHLTEHLLFEADASGFERLVVGSGGEVNAYTTHDDTVIFVNTFAANVEAVLLGLRDFLRMASIEPGLFERERQVVLEEIRMHRDEPLKTMADEVFGLVFAGGPYARPVAGNPESVAAIGRDDVLAFVRDNYRDARLTLTVTGAVDSARLRPLIEREFSVNPAEPASPPPLQQPPPPGRPRVRVIPADVSEVHLTAGVAVEGLSGAPGPEDEVIAAVLGGLDTSRLMRSLRIDRQVASSVGAELLSERGVGLLSAHATFPVEDFREGLGRFLAELAGLGAKPVAPFELERARRMIVQTEVYNDETIERQAGRMTFDYTMTGDIRFLERYHARLARLEAPALNDRVRQVWRPERFHAVAMLPAELADQMTEDDLESALRDAFETAGREAGEVGTTGMRHLANGIPVVWHVNRTAPVVSLSVFIKGGAALEPAGMHGLAELTAEMLTYGSPDRGEIEIHRFLDETGGYLDAYSTKLVTGVRMKSLALYLDRAVEVLADCVLRPAFREADLIREKRDLIEDLRVEIDDPHRKFMKEFLNRYFGSHPLGNYARVTEETVGRIGRNAMIDFYARILAPANIIIAVSGDFDPRHLLAELEERFGSHTGGAEVDISPAALDALPAVRGTEVYANRSKQNAYLYIGFPARHLVEQENYLLPLLDHALVGQQGRLFRRLRADMGSVYLVDSFFKGDVGTGMYVVTAICAPARVQEVLAAVREVVADVRANGLSEEEVDHGRRHLRYMAASMLQNNTMVGFSMGMALARGENPRRFLELDRLIDGISREEVNAFVGGYLDLDRTLTTLFTENPDAPPADAR